MKNIDKAIILNFKIIKEQIAILGACCIFVLMFVAFIFRITLAYVIMAGMAITLLFAYKKLFAKTTFGENASLYNVLPISNGEMVLSKVFVATATTLITELLLALIVIAAFGIASLGGDYYIRIILTALAYLYEAGPLTIVVFMITWLAADFFASSVIFASFMQSYTKTGKLFMVTLTNVILFFAVKSFFFVQVAAIYTGEYNILFQMMCFAIFAAGGIFGMKYTKAKLDNY